MSRHDPGESDAYTGVENLETMAEAVNYNAFLHGLVADLQRDRPGALLDFGAGNGLFADAARAQAKVLTCIEPDAGLRARLAQRGHVALADLSSVSDGSQDAIYSLNVLEHIEDDAAALADLHRVLRPGGRLLLYVPAFAVLYTAMDRKVGHHRRYRCGELRRLLDAAGFVTTDLRYVDSLGFFATLAFRLLGNDDGTINRRALILYDRLVFPLSRGLDRICGQLFGKNALAFASKPET